MIHEIHERLTGSLHERPQLATTALICIVLATAGVSAFSGGVIATSNPSPNQWNAQNASQSQAPLIVTHDVVISGDKPLAPGQSDCGLTSQFYHGQKSVFRVKVINPATGKAMNSSQLKGVSVHITSGSGTTLQAKYEKHGNDRFWVAPWIIPSSVPAGKVNYTISVTGQNAQPVNFAVPESEMTVLNKSVSDIKQTQSGSSNQTPSSGQSGSLPIVFWVVVVAVAVIVVGLIWNAERQ